MKKRNILAFIFVFALMSVLMCGTAFAAGTAQASLSGGGEFNKGDTVAVTLTYSGDTFGSADVLFTYDSSVLEYSSCDGAVAYGGSGNVKATMSDVSNSSTLSCTLRFKAVKAGESYVTATTQTLYNFNEEELTATAVSVKATVKDASQEASGNAELLSLMVSGGTLSPSFNSNITSYTMSVPYDTTVCTLSVKTDDDKAEYKITGSKELQVGTNVREVIVTAENGNTKTYTVTITRAAQAASSQTETNEPASSEETEGSDAESDEGEETEESEDPADDGRIKVSIGSNEFYVVDDFTKIEIPDGFSQDIKKYDEKDIPVIVSEDGSLVLAMLQNVDDEETGWYFFNETKQNFSSKKSLTAEQIMKYESALKQVEALNADGAAGKTEIDTVDVLTIALGATVSLLLIVLIVLVIKKKK